MPWIRADPPRTALLQLTGSQNRRQACRRGASNAKPSLRELLYIVAPRPTRWSRQFLDSAPTGCAVRCSGIPAGRRRCAAATGSATLKSKFQRRTGRRRTNDSPPPAMISRVIVPSANESRSGAAPQGDPYVVELPARLVHAQRAQLQHDRGQPARGQPARGQQAQYQQVQSLQTISFPAPPPA